MDPVSSPVEQYFYNGGLNCAETTLRCLIEEGVIDAPLDAVRMMTGFGGGMQRGTTCGAVVGAVAAIGWVLGRTEPGESRAESAEAVRVFLERFEKEFGSLNCSELQELHMNGCALKSDEMYHKCADFLKKSLALTKCAVKWE